MSKFQSHRAGSRDIDRPAAPESIPGLFDTFRIRIVRILTKKFERWLVEVGSEIDRFHYNEWLSVDHSCA